MENFYFPKKTVKKHRTNKIVRTKKMMKIVTMMTRMTTMRRTILRHSFKRTFNCQYLFGISYVTFCIFVHIKVFNMLFPFNIELFHFLILIQIIYFDDLFCPIWAHNVCQLSPFSLRRKLPHFHSFSVYKVYQIQIEK